jgi:hypothetical protein
MTADALFSSPGAAAQTVSWIATGIGLGMWLWSWLGEKNAIRKLRLRDCGVVLLFAGILARIVVQERAMTPFDWAMSLLGPLFIAAALWRLGRTASAGAERG